MVWHSTWPVGTVSVRANRLTGQDNTNYIKDTMGPEVVGTNTVTTRDHFWDVDPTLDGRHRFIQSPKFTVGGNPDNPVIGTAMDGVLYLKQVSVEDTTIQGFYRNAQNIYQYIPTYVTGSMSITGAFTTIVAIPKNVYGDIFLFRSNAAGDLSLQTGIFKSTSSVVDCIAFRYINDANSAIQPLRLGQSGLNLRVRVQDAASGNTWQYKITYRAYA